LENARDDHLSLGPHVDEMNIGAAKSITPEVIARNSSGSDLSYYSSPEHRARPGTSGTVKPCARHPHRDLIRRGNTVILISHYNHPYDEEYKSGCSNWRDIFVRKDPYIHR